MSPEWSGLLAILQVLIDKTTVPCDKLKSHSWWGIPAEVERERGSCVSWAQCDCVQRASSTPKEQR